MLCCATVPPTRVIARRDDGGVDVAVPTASDCFTSSFSEQFPGDAVGDHITAEEWGVVLSQTNAILHRHGIGRTPLPLLIAAFVVPPLALLCCAVRSCVLEDAARRALVEVHVYLAVDVTNVFRSRGIAFSLDFVDVAPGGTDVPTEYGQTTERRWFVRVRLPGGAGSLAAARASDAPDAVAFGSPHAADDTGTPWQAAAGRPATALRRDDDGGRGAARSVRGAPLAALSPGDLAVLRRGSAAASELELAQIEQRDEGGDERGGAAGGTPRSAVSPSGTAMRPNPLVSIVLGPRGGSPRGAPAPLARGGASSAADGVRGGSPPPPPPATAGTRGNGAAAASSARLTDVRRGAAGKAQAWHDTAGPGVEGVLLPARTVLRHWRVALMRRDATAAAAHT